MNVEAPMWSAWITGCSPVNSGTAGLVLAVSALYFSTSRLMSSRSAVRSVTIPSTCLKNPMMSFLQPSSSAGVFAASSCPPMRSYRPLSSVTIGSAMDRLRVHRLERDPLGRRQQLGGLQQHDRARARRDDALDVLGREAAHDARRRR